MKKAMLILVLSVLLLSGLLLAGCATAQDEEERLTSSQNIVGRNVQDEWEKVTGEKVAEGDIIVSDAHGLPESHAVMAGMILMSNGMNADLSKYKDISLVDFTDASGEKRAAVVIGFDQVLFGKGVGTPAESPSTEIAP